MANRWPRSRSGPVRRLLVPIHPRRLDNALRVRSMRHITGARATTANRTPRSFQFSAQPIRADAEPLSSDRRVKPIRCTQPVPTSAKGVHPAFINVMWARFVPSQPGRTRHNVPNCGRQPCRVSHRLLGPNLPIPHPNPLAAWAFDSIPAAPGHAIMPVSKGAPQLWQGENAKSPFILRCQPNGFSTIGQMSRRALR